ncbi:MAG: gas vesicle protein [Actinomycetes bacterium]
MSIRPTENRVAGPRPDSLADVLERVLDRGVVVAGDIVVNVLDIELLTLKVRLLIASADTAREMGIDWWTHDPFLNSEARGLEQENAELRQRLEALERAIGDGERPPPDSEAAEDAETRGVDTTRDSSTTETASTRETSEER